METAISAAYLLSMADLGTVLAARLRAIRQRCARTQEEFAAKIGTTQAHVSRLENGIGWQQIRELGVALEGAGVDPLELIGGDQASPVSAEEAELLLLARGADPAVLRIVNAILQREAARKDLKAGA